MFCSCGKLWDPAELRDVRFSTDANRGRALDEMRRGVETGRAEFQRDVDQRFEREVEDHYSQLI